MPLKTHNRKTYKHKKKRTSRHKKKRTSRHKKKRIQKKTYRHKKKRLTGGMDDEQAQAVRATRLTQAQAQKAARGTKEGKAAQRKLWQAASLRPPRDWHASARGAVVPAAKSSGVSEAGGSCWNEDFKEEDCCYGAGPSHPLKYYRDIGELPINGEGNSYCWNDNAGNATEYTYETCCPWYSICNAAYVGDPSGLKKIRDSNVDVTKSNIHGETPMHYAAIANNAEAIILLKEKGFDVNAEDNSGWRPINHASHCDSFEAVAALKDAGAQPAPAPAPSPAPAPDE